MMSRLSRVAYLLLGIPMLLVGIVVAFYMPTVVREGEPEDTFFSLPWAIGGLLTGSFWLLAAARGSHAPRRLSSVLLILAFPVLLSGLLLAILSVPAHGIDRLLVASGSGACVLSSLASIRRESAVLPGLGR